METQKTLNSQNNLEKENKNNISLFQPILQRYSHQKSIVLSKKQTNRSVEQNREPRNESMLIWVIIYNKGGKNIQWGKDSLFYKWSWENWTGTCKRIKMDYFLTPYTKINSKLIKVLNVRLETIKLLEENIGSTLFDISLSNITLDMSPQIRETEAKIKGTKSNLKAFAQQRKPSAKQKGQLRNGRRYLQIIYPTRG